jgi:uncharacterized protein (TIGR03382 family)
LPGAFVPAGEGVTIPANAPGLFWRPSMTSGQPADPSTVRLTRLGDTTPIPFTPVAEVGSSDWVLVPQQPFIAGTQYVLEESVQCNGAPGARTVFTAGPEAPLPTTLGTLSIIGHGNFMDLEVATGSGSCSTMVGATVLSIFLEPSAEIEPWKDLLLYDTLVDGQPWVNQSTANMRPAPGASWRGRGKDLLYRICEPNPDASYPGLAVGGHQVAFRATLPGTSMTIATPAQALELMCTSRPPDEEEEDGDDGGCATTTPASATFVFALLALLLVRRTRS